MKKTDKKKTNQHRPIIISDIENIAIDGELEKAREIGIKITEVYKEYRKSLKPLMREYFDLIGYSEPDDELGVLEELLDGEGWEIFDPDQWVEYLKNVRKHWVVEELKEKGFFKNDDGG